MTLTLTNAASGIRSSSMYLKTAFFISVVTVVRYVLDSTLGEEYPYILYIFPAIYLANLAGWKPGAAALVFGLLIADYLFTTPRFSFRVDSPAHQVGLFLYLAVGGACISMADARRVALSRVEAKAAAVANESMTNRRIQDKLRNKHTRLLDHTFDPILTWRLDGEITFWNMGAERLYGYTASEAIGKVGHELLQTVFPNGWDAFNETLRLEGQWEGELRQRTKAGEWIPVDSHMLLVTKETSAAEVIEANSDASPKKKAEEIRTQLAAIVESSEDAIISKSLDGVIESWNKGATELFGYSPEEAIGKPIFMMIPAELHEEERSILERLRKGDRIRIFETMRIAKGGGRIIVSMTVSPLRNSEGTVTGASSVLRDVTEMKHAEARLRDATERIRGVVEQAVDGIITFNSDRIVETVNPAVTRIFGYAPEEVVGHNVSMLMPEPSRGLRKDGTEFPLELSVNEIRLASGRLFTGIVRDVSERIKLEEQLRQSQKMDAFGQLAGGVAHDFNNLLTIINGYSEYLLDETGSTDAARAPLEAILDAGKRAAALTAQLLAFSRQSVLEPVVLDPNAVVNETAKMLNRLIGEDIQLVTSLNAGNGRVKVDPGQLGQVLMNLAVNSRDAMPTGGRLTIETRDATLEKSRIAGREVNPGDYVVIAVSDTGTGMTPEVKARVFEPFFTTKGAGKGTGLGLATAYGIIEQSGGYMEVFSEVGVGTKFKIYLPTTPEGGEAHATNSQLDNVRGGTERVLLVEDQADVRKLALVALQMQGYTVIEASDGPDAFRKVDHDLPALDLLVTDVVMPGMSGRQVAENLAILYPGIKVLYTSGYTDDAVVRHGIFQADVAFLRKPYTPVTLARKVREVLDQL